MPTCKIANTSTLLSTNGWVLVENFVENGVVLGIDREGKINFREVLIFSEPKRIRIVYLGHSGCFGAFNLDTKIMAFNGDIVRLSDGILNDNFPDWTFERIESYSGDSFEGPESKVVWENLRKNSIHEENQKLQIKINGKANSRDISFPKSIEYKSIEQIEFILLDKYHFLEEYNTDWARTIINVFGAMFFDGIIGDEGLQLNIRRSQYLFALWFQYAKLQYGESVSFSFDTLQHTSLVVLDELSQVLSPGEKIRTLFLSLDEGEEKILYWDDNSWNPLSSGFILCG